MHPACGACGRDYDLQVFLHLPSNTPIVLCTSCAAHEMSRAEAARQYQYQGTYLSIQERVTNELVREAQASYTPYDQAMAEYYEEMAAIEDADRRRMTNVTLNGELEPLLDHDTVLDAYIEANPDKFSYVAYGDNMEDTRLAGLRQWHDLRQSAIGG